MADAQTRYEPFELDGAWLVYPRGDKWDLTTRMQPVAAFVHEAHAREFCAHRWPETGEVIPCASDRPESETVWLDMPAFLRRDRGEPQ